jgi:hypothetical protein
MSKKKYYIILSITIILIPLCIYTLYLSIWFEFFEVLFPLNIPQSELNNKEIELIQQTRYLNSIKLKHTVIQLSSLIIGISALLYNIYLLIKRKSILKSYAN